MGQSCSRGKTPQNARRAGEDTAKRAVRARTPQPRGAHEGKRVENASYGTPLGRRRLARARPLPRGRRRVPGVPQDVRRRRADDGIGVLRDGDLPDVPPGLPAARAERFAVRLPALQRRLRERPGEVPRAARGARRGRLALRHRDASVHAPAGPARPRAELTRGRRAVWKSNFRRPTPSTRRCLRHRACSMAWR